MRDRGGTRTLRIIGGEWRGRKFTFPEVDGIRPTPDRVRETLFNWLMPVMEGARCLDLFTGSGALGLEALSRGAREVVFVDTEAKVIRALREHLAILKCETARLVQAEAQQFLRGTAQAFDVVFLDPPFGKGLLEPICQQLEAGGWLSAQAYIYMEQESSAPPPALPNTWAMHRDKLAGQVHYQLARRQSP